MPDGGAAAARPQIFSLPPAPSASSSARGLVLELFAGIGGGSYALRAAGLPDSDLAHTILFETDPACVLVLQSNLLGQHVSLSDARAPNGQVSCATAFSDGPFHQVTGLLQRFPNVDSILVVGGSPCQGFSRANQAPLGLEDPRSCLVYVFAVIVARLRAGLAALGRSSAVVNFLVENVQMPSAYSDPISELLGVQPLNICASTISPTRRDRLYWTSLPGTQQAPLEQVDLTPDDVLDPGWAPAWVRLLPDEVGTTADRWHLPTRPWAPGLPPECPTRCWSFGPRMYGPHHLAINDDTAASILDDLTAHFAPGSYTSARRAAFIEDIHTGSLGQWVRPLRPHELERALGYPEGASDFSGPASAVDFDNDIPRELGRCARLANGFSVPVVSGLLRSWVEALLNSTSPPCTPGPEPLGRGPRAICRTDALITLLPGGLGRLG